MARTNGNGLGAAEVTEIVTPHRGDRKRHEDAGRLEGRELDDAFIFPGDCSGFIDPDKFDAEVWKPIAEKAGMAGTRFHDLRHFFASQLIAQGETAAYVRDQMGHSSIKVTFDTYGHLFPGRGKEASARYEKSMADARVRQKAEAGVSNPLVIDGDDGPEGTVTN